MTLNSKEKEKSPWGREYGVLNVQCITLDLINSLGHQ
jgi:hypothetical protein